jgi:hypothetical protein
MWIDITSFLEFFIYLIVMHMSNITPKKLAIYYSYPSLVNGSNGNISSAVSTFSQYDLVVFGDGLESPTHPDNANAISIINDPGMANTLVFGYINSTLDLDTIQGNIDLWVNMGVRGIFCDQFGYDFNTSRQKQREIIWCIHSKSNSLKAFVNAWNPDDVFSPAVDATNNPNGLTTRLLPKDYYLAESFAVINGSYDDSDLDNNGIKDFQDKASKMTNYKATYGTNLAAIATLGSATFVQNLADYSYFSAVLNKFDAWGFGEQYYSASSASLPFRTRATFYGTKFTSDISTTGGILEHRTNVGIHVDTNAHTINILLN